MMTHGRPGLFGAGVLALLLARCNNGTETDNPAGPGVSFQGSQCQHEGTSHDSSPPPSSAEGARDGVGTTSARLEVAGDYTRLECVAWHRDGSELHVSYRNFRGACGIEWGEGKVSVEGGAVLLEAHNPGCRVAKCGNCFYDLEFAVQGAPEGDLNVAVAETDGAAKVCQPGFELKGVTLLGPSGVRCSPLEPGLFMPPPPECERYAACSDSCTCTSGTRCASRDLEASSGSVCVPECTTSAECPVPEAFTCTQGLCRTLPWTG